MHDIDTTARELVDELLTNEAETFDPENLDPEGYPEIGSSDAEADLAAELLEISDEAELDHFVGKLVKGASKLMRSPAGKLLKNALRGIASKALPVAGAALGNAIVPGLGGAIGGKLAGALGSSMGLEAEAMSDEELQMEVAKRVVRTAKQAVSQVARDPRVASAPRAVVRDAVARAVGAQLPGLLRTGTPVIQRVADHVPGAAGRWVRRGNRIILFGV